MRYAQDHRIDIGGGLLVAGAFTAAAVTGGTALAQEDTTAAEDARPRPPARAEVLAEVLGGLVSDGTITQAQADAVTEALEAKAAEIREEFPNRRHRDFRRGFRLGGLLADGEITADELAELPDDHPLKDPDGPAAEYLEDGRLTQDELRQLHEQRRAERRAAADGTDS